MSNFYASLPKLTVFEGIVNRSAYRALPDDWLIGVTDVVASTAAVANGRYKAVNLAGAAVVSALANVKGSLDFPYVFTGDGMVCAIPPEERQRVEQTLATAADWVARALDLDLRAAIVPVSDIRAAGHDVRIARFTPNSGFAYAMFSGGGLAWTEQALKSGALPQLDKRDGRPDLSGLSCRFRPIPSRKGVILSMIVAPAGPLPSEPFRILVDDLLKMTATGHPIPPGGPDWGWPPAGLELEARLHRRLGRPLIWDVAVLGIKTLFAALLMLSNIRLGAFQPSRYRAELVENTDFRKFGDGLMMTVDCSLDLAAAIDLRLAAAEQDGIAHSGTHRQDAALMTCVVPSPSHPGHIHFIDGAGGGYTLAALQLKDRRAARAARSTRDCDETPALAGAPS